MKTVFLSLALMVAAIVSAQVPFLGEWVTIDDASGEKKSVVNIYQADNGMYMAKS